MKTWRFEIHQKFSGTSHDWSEENLGEKPHFKVYVPGYISKPCSHCVSWWGGISSNRRISTRPRSDLFLITACGIFFFASCSSKKSIRKPWWIHFFLWVPAPWSWNHAATALYKAAFVVAETTDSHIASRCHDQLLLITMPDSRFSGYGISKGRRSLQTFLQLVLAHWLWYQLLMLLLIILVAKPTTPCPCSQFNSWVVSEFKQNT